MSDPQAQELLIDHSQHPRCHGRLADASHQGLGDNPLCGDKIELDLRIRDQVIEAAAIRCVGCAISTASASMMAEGLSGLSVDQARALFEAVHGVLTGADEDRAAELPQTLKALAVVRRYPLRVKCATLPWHVMRQTLSGGEGPVSTE